MPYWVYDLLSLISAVVTIATAIFAIFKGVVSVIKLDNGTYTISFNPILVWVCSILFCCLIVFGIKVRKYGALKTRIRKKFSFNYYQFLHDFRNSYFDILNNHKTRKNESKEGRIKLLTQETQSFLEDALDYLCDVLEANTGEKICACVKLIENTGNATNIDKDKATVITFSRSKNTDKTRKSNDEKQNKSISIKDNTDFYDILDENSSNTNSYFYQSDLVQYAKDLEKVGKEYRNTTKHYERYYRGTIVAPIRILRKRLHYVDENNGYNIIGFLCVDSLSTNAFRNKDDDREDYSNIVKSFAAEIYIILNKYNYYLQKINKGE